MKEQPIKIIDHVMAINKKFFHEIGGFREQIGTFAFLDLRL
jgi:hypothetical protein